MGLEFTLPKDQFYDSRTLLGEKPLQGVPSHLVLDLDQTASLLKEFESIPDKLSYKIGDVAELTGLKPYVLRFWENEFPSLRPKKSMKNQRVYTKRDVELIFMIKKLLYTDRYSIEGAQCVLKPLRRVIRRAQNMKEGHLKIELTKLKTQELILDIQNAMGQIRSF